MDDICRCCLAADRTYVVQNADYQVFYEQITDVPFQDGSGKPTSLCYECLYLFRKCMQLRDKCLRADRVLNDFIENGEEISGVSILKINRDELLLSSKCTITKVYCFEMGTECKRDVKIEYDNYELYENRDDEVKLEDRQSQYQDINESNIIIDHCSDDNTELNGVPFMDSQVKIEIDFVGIKENTLQDTESKDVFENKPLIKQENKQNENKDNCIVSSVKEEVIVDHLISGLERVCTECNFKCLEQDVFEKHLKSHKHITEQFSDSKSGLKRGGGESKQVANHRKLSAKKTYQCDVCSISLSTKYNLFRHKKIHTGEKPYKCDYCNYKYREKNSLLSHIGIHTGEKLSKLLPQYFKCDICGFHSYIKNCLVRHIRKHTGDKPYKCNFCNVRFANKYILVNHIRTHTGEKPYKCNFCDYKCAQKGVLVEHNRIHTGDKPFKCEVCNFKTARKTHLGRHMRTHTAEKPYMCDLCDFKCSFRASLVAHIKRHTGEKPYKCDICNFKCSDKYYLKVHNRIHTGEKPYKCDFCNFSCLYKKRLNKHNESHIEIKPL